MTGYCQQWILGYAALVKSFHALPSECIPELHQSSEEAKEAFMQVKQALAQVPALGLPDYNTPFTLYCNETGDFTLGVLTQIHGDKLRPIAYYRLAFDPVAAGLALFL